MGALDNTRPSSVSYAFLYIIIIQGILSAVVSGGIEFAIAYGMYYGKSQQVTLWAFPHTLSGDCALSLFIQVVITWYIEELLIGWDHYHGSICRLDFIPNIESNKWIRKFLEVDRGIAVPTSHEDMKYTTFLHKLFIKNPGKNNLYNIIVWVIHKTLRALLLSAIIWAVEWPVTMGILAGIGTKRGKIEYTFGNYPTPQIVKLIYAGVLGWVSTPVCIIVIILRNDWYEKRQLEEIESSSQESGIEGEKSEEV